MTTFLIIAAIMVATALVLLIPPLLGRRQLRESDRDQQNVRIARERLAELQAEVDSGVITQKQFELSRGELEQALVEDLAGEKPTGDSRHSLSGRRTAVLLGIAVPALAGALYIYLGNPGAINIDGSSAAMSSQPAQQLPSIDEMTDRLIARLNENPDDAEGWFMLGRSYMLMGRHKEAANALEKVYQLVGDNPNVLLHYADALAMSQDGRLSGKPFALIRKALALEPDNTMGLWLAGLAYEEQGDHETAVEHWRRLQPLLKDEPESLVQLKPLIARAEKKRGGADGRPPD